MGEGREKLDSSRTLLASRTLGFLVLLTALFLALIISLKLIKIEKNTGSIY